MTNDNTVILDFVRPYAEDAKDMIPHNPRKNFLMLKERMQCLIRGKGYSDGMAAFLATWAMYIWVDEGLI